MVSKKGKKSNKELLLLLFLSAARDEVCGWMWVCIGAGGDASYLGRMYIRSARLQHCTSLPDSRAVRPEACLVRYYPSLAVEDSCSLDILMQAARPDAVGQC